jgi:NitT/TauT family transport system ATP-binding protein
VVMAADPGRIFTEISIEAPYPRGPETREDPSYYRVLTAIREALRLGGATSRDRDPMLT